MSFDIPLLFCCSIFYDLQGSQIHFLICVEWDEHMPKWNCCLSVDLEQMIALEESTHLCIIQLAAELIASLGIRDRNKVITKFFPETKVI